MAVPATITPSAVAPTAIPIGNATDGAELGVGEGGGTRDASRLVYAEERGKPFWNC